MLRFLLPVLFMIVSVPAFGQCFNPQCGGGALILEDGINLPCLVQAGDAFFVCRESGGGILPCAIRGFSTYLDCNRNQARLRRLARRTRSQRLRF